MKHRVLTIKFPKDTDLDMYKIKLEKIAKKNKKTINAMLSELIINQYNLK